MSVLVLYKQNGNGPQRYVSRDDTDEKRDMKSQGSDEDNSEDEEDLWFRKTEGVCKEIGEDGEISEDQRWGLQPSMTSSGVGDREGDAVRIPRSASMDRWDHCPALATASHD